MAHLGIKHCVKNYSLHKEKLLLAFTECLNFDDGSLLQPPEVPNTNRSLSASELYLQRTFNKFLGRDVGKKSSKLISDRLCNSIPVLEQESMILEESTYHKLVSRIEPLVGSINRYLPQNERLIIEPDPPNETIRKICGQSITFSRQQIEVLAEGLAGSIQKNLLMDEYFSHMIRIAAKLEKSNSDFSKEISALYRLAAVLRPTDSTVQKALKMIKE